MRTFRITLSHGSESVTFDGAGARSGSMFHVRRDAIEGLWSSPASKVSLTERETSNGASPISDGETLYAARTVVIPFAIQSNYNHTDLIRARILLGRLIGWHDVRMDVYDDGDETVLFGYVEAKYSDIPYDHTDTGTIALVCPDPRRMSKHASTVTMNTSSSSLGGLSFGTPAYELAWTGTPNASTSTLSQDGQVVATNLALDPTVTQTLAAFSGEGTWTRGADASSPSGSSWTFTCTSLNWQWLGTLYLNPLSWNTSDMIPPGTPLHMRIWCSAQRGDGSTGNIGVILKEFSDDSGSMVDTQSIGVTFPTSPGWVDVDMTSGTTSRRLYALSSFYGIPVGSTVMIGPVMLCTQKDWQTMQSWGVEWFDGDSQSPQPNAGLAFPLNFGQSGNTGNTGMMVNNGSYVSTPIITAHGVLDSGLTIHWTTSDGNEGDLSFNGSIQNVPVTINTDTHSAIMGGLDVSYQLGSRDWPRIPAGGSCSFALLASGGGWVTVQSHDTYM